jgi:GNAT superfamily N-acetyltransferase
MDVERITTLCHQLGYSTSAPEVARRFQQIEQDSRHAVFVAERSGNNYVIGWLHAQLCQLLDCDLQVEVCGLVIDEGYRRCGAGRLLMQRAEGWAIENDCWAVRLRSNIIREDAHRFYEMIGYSNTKTQLTFRKIL